MVLSSIRRNNPGNIEKGPKYVGMATEQDSSRFIVFSTPEYGIRAICKILITYKKKYSIDTIREVIERYAPRSENKTDAYIKNVSEWSGLDPDDEFNAYEPGVLQKLVPAIIRQEVGYQPYTAEQITKGIHLALA